MAYRRRKRRRRLSKLEMSQRAHSRIAFRCFDINDKRYHTQIFRLQALKKRVLTSEEKSYIFRSIFEGTHRV